MTSDNVAPSRRPSVTPSRDVTPSQTRNSRERMADLRRRTALGDARAVVRVRNYRARSELKISILPSCGFKLCTA